jgi:hypothetical protein
VPPHPGKGQSSCIYEQRQITSLMSETQGVCWSGIGQAASGLPARQCAGSDVGRATNAEAEKQLKSAFFSRTRISTIRHRSAPDEPMNHPTRQGSHANVARSGVVSCPNRNCILSVHQIELRADELVLRGHLSNPPVIFVFGGFFFFGRKPGSGMAGGRADMHIIRLASIAGSSTDLYVRYSASQSLLLLVQHYTC